MKHTTRAFGRPLIALLLLLLVFSIPAAGGELQGVTLPDQVEAGGETLVLNGMALRKVAIFKVYVAGLYLPVKQSDGAAVLAADTARHTVLHFLRGVDRGRICDGWYEGLKANTPGAPSTIKAQFDTLCEWMADAEKGDAFTFTYLPGTGTEVRVKGKLRGTLEGKAFADALFAAWIGTHPGPGEDFKKGLLGG